MFNFIILFVLVCLFFLLYKIVKKSIRVETPEQIVQREIDENTQELNKARNSLEESAINIRILKNAVISSEQDVRLLEVRAESSLASVVTGIGDENKAKKDFIRLQKEKIELNEKKSDYQKAVENHEIAQFEIDKYQLNLNNLSNKIKEKKIRVDLANARQKNADFELSQQRIKTDLEVEAKTAETMASFNSNVPNEFESAATDEEFQKWKSSH